MYQDFRKKQE